MTQAVTWFVILLAIALCFWAIVHENGRRKNRTSEEWERDFAAGRGKTSQFIQAGALGLEAILIDEKRQAIEYKQDEQQGMTKTGSKGDGRNRTSVHGDGKD